MDLKQYTPDAICRSMGMPGFVEPGWSPPTLRILLMPSFDPEVCLTLTGGVDARLSVVALAEMLWRQPVPRSLPTWSEQVTVPMSVVSELTTDFDAALIAERDAKGHMVCADGMPVACLLKSEDLEEFACNPYRPPVTRFVSSFIRAAWQSCRDAGVRNSLAVCGRYVGLALPVDTQLPAPDLARIMVLGTPEERANYFGQLQERKAVGRRPQSRA